MAEVGDVPLMRYLWDGESSTNDMLGLGVETILSKIDGQTNNL
jgi:hypothetical protein